MLYLSGSGLKADIIKGPSGRENLMQGIESLGEGRAEEANREKWGNSEITNSRKSLLSLGKRDKKRSLCYQSPGARTYMWSQGHLATAKQDGWVEWEIPWLLLPPSLQSSTSASHWLSLPGNQKAKQLGKCSFLWFGADAWLAQVVNGTCIVLALLEGCGCRLLPGLTHTLNTHLPNQTESKG